MSERRASRYAGGETLIETPDAVAIRVAPLRKAAHRSSIPSSVTSWRVDVAGEHRNVERRKAFRQRPEGAMLQVQVREHEKSGQESASDGFASAE